MENLNRFYSFMFIHPFKIIHTINWINVWQKIKSKNFLLYDSIVNFKCITHKTPWILKFEYLYKWFGDMSCGKFSFYMIPRSLCMCVWCLKFSKWHSIDWDNCFSAIYISQYKPKPHTIIIIIFRLILIVQQIYKFSSTSN